MRVDVFDFELPRELIAQRPAEPRDAARLLRVTPADAWPTARSATCRTCCGPATCWCSTTPASSRPGSSAGAARRPSRSRCTRRWRLALARLRQAGQAAAAGDRGRLRRRFLGRGRREAARRARSAALRPRRRRADGGPARARRDAAAALHHAAGGRRCARPADYQTMFARAGGRRRRADRRRCISPPALLARPGGARHRLGARDAACRRRHLPAGQGRRHRTTMCMHAEWGEIDRRDRGEPINARARRGRPDRRGRHDQPAPAGERRGDGRHACSPFAGDTRLFILPGYRFRAVDLLLTNFHLPRSTLFMLVCAFAGLGAHARRLCPRDRDRLSLLFLWRRLPAGPRRHERLTSASTCSATDGAARARPAAHRPWHGRDAGLHAGRHRRHGEGDDRRCGAPRPAREIVLGNTYHLMLRPGAERVARLGGLHRFMNWHGPILTDSGGFQVMSLAGAAQADRDGVTFQLASRRLASTS